MDEGARGDPEHRHGRAPLTIGDPQRGFEIDGPPPRWARWEPHVWLVLGTTLAPTLVGPLSVLAVGLAIAGLVRLVYRQILTGSVSPPELAAIDPFGRFEGLTAWSEPDPQGRSRR